MLFDVIGHDIVIVIDFVSVGALVWSAYLVFFFFQAEDGIRVAQESRGLGDVYKRQTLSFNSFPTLKNGNFLGSTCILSPVFGFLPV